MKNVRRKPEGSAITEMGPALFILLILIFFPMMNLIQIGAAYALANTYHQYISREIAFKRPELSSAAISKVNTEVDANSLFQFVRIVGRTVDSVQFLDKNGAVVSGLPAAGDTSDAARATRNSIAQVRVQTTMTVSPYITIPFFASIPGLGAPVPFRVSSDRPQDEKGLN